MRFGLAYDLRNPRQWLEPFNRLYRDFLDQAERVEALGYDSLWVSEHHYSGDDGWIPAGLTLTAAVAARTKRMRLGSWIIALPLHDPVRVAEQITVLDYISNGRIRLGIALGYRVQEFKIHNMDRAERGPRLDEGLEIIRKCWTEETFSFKGRFNNLTEMQFYPKDYEIHTLISMQSPIVCKDPDATWAKWKDRILYRLEWYDRWYNEAADLPKEQLARMADMDTQRERARQSVMTPEQCRNMIGEFLCKVPCTEIVLWGCYPGIPLDISYEWVELFATDVMPHFQNAIGHYSGTGTHVAKR